MLGWYDATLCEKTLSGMLTSEEENVTDAWKHEIVTRYKATSESDPTIHYLPLGSVIRAPIKTDGVSVYTNGQEEATLFGYGDAAPGTVATKGNDGNLRWMPAGGGGAIRLVGTSGEAVVGSGSVTNTITFQSAQDSNVSVSVAPDSSGNATVTIGVYYVP